MNVLRVGCALVVALTLYNSVLGCQDDDEDHFEIVPLPLLVKKFIVADQATSFSIGEHNGTSNVLAAFDQEGQLRVAVTRGRGGKVFKTELELQESPRLLVADLDGDSNAEILVCSDKLRVYQIDEDELSLAWTSPETFEDSPSPRLGLSDLDGDGHVDIAVLNYLSDRNSESDSLYLYRNLKTGLQFSLTGSIAFTDEHGYHSTSGIAIGDFTGDVREDIVIGNDNGWMWLIDVKNGKPTVEKTWKVKSGGAIGHGLAVGNMVAGQKKELLVGTNGGDIHVYRFPEGKDPEVIASASPGRYSYGIQACDMDGDGMDEFLLANNPPEGARTEIWKLGGDQLFAVWGKDIADFEHPRLEVRDLNGDGTSELVIYSLLKEGKRIEAIKPVLSR